MYVNNQYLVPSTRGQALIGTLPFLLFGLVSMVEKTETFNHLHPTTFYISFTILIFLGLLVSWVRGFPLWSYSYLGWSLLMTWWWSNVRINGMYWGFFTLWALGITGAIALIWTRSLDPLKKFLHDIWQDWTRLSLAMYTFIGFVYLIYDENHHPYLLVFMAIATLAISAGAWFFLRSRRLIGRFASILGGFLAGHVIGQICDRTWDAAAYYNLPVGPPTPWYTTIFRTVTIFIVFSIILLWPAVIALLHHIATRPLKPDNHD